MHESFPNEMALLVDDNVLLFCFFVVFLSPRGKRENSRIALIGFGQIHFAPSGKKGKN